MAEWFKATGLRSVSVFTAWVRTPLVVTLALKTKFYTVKTKFYSAFIPLYERALPQTTDFNSVEECLTVVVYISNQKVPCSNQGSRKVVCAPLAQSVEHLAVNQKVKGSNPLWSVYKSIVAQRKRAGLITLRAHDRNVSMLFRTIMSLHNRACGAIGSALALQARGSGIETRHVHSGVIV
jgi:hypothetical protein